MGQLKVAQVVTEGLVIDSSEHSLLDGSGNIMHFPTNIEETVHFDVKPLGITMFINRGGALRYSLSLSPKVLPGSLIYSSSQPASEHLNLVDYPTFLSDGVLILGDHQKVMHSIVSFEMHLYSHLFAFAHLFQMFTRSLGIQYHQEDVVVTTVAVVHGLMSIALNMGQVGTELNTDFGL